MPMYEFTLHLSGDAAGTEEFAEAAYEAGCDDATFGVFSGQAEATFHRNAKTFADAVLSAIHDLAAADPSVEVERVEPLDEQDGSPKDVDVLNSLLTLNRYRISATEAATLYGRIREGVTLRHPRGSLSP